MALIDNFTLIDAWEVISEVLELSKQNKVSLRSNVDLARLTSELASSLDDY